MLRLVKWGDPSKFSEDVQGKKAANLLLTEALIFKRLGERAAESHYPGVRFWDSSSRVRTPSGAVPGCGFRGLPVGPRTSHGLAGAGATGSFALLPVPYSLFPSTWHPAPDTYSYRNATMGSTFVARRAGR